MGGSQSDLNGGFRVFRISPNSPAEIAGLEVFFDFIVELDNEKVEPHQRLFFEKIRASENQECLITVYSVRTHLARQLKIVPRKWGGVGLLGATVRYDNIDLQSNGGVRVLDVFPNSPAHQAGLVPFKDYLLGTAEVIFRDVDEFVDYVSGNLDKTLQVSVYNTDLEHTREISITPNTKWGGDGCLGCDIGMGLLHTIPLPRAASVSSASVEAMSPPSALPTPQGHEVGKVEVSSGETPKLIPQPAESSQPASQARHPSTQLDEQNGQPVGRDSPTAESSGPRPSQEHDSSLPAQDMRTSANESLQQNADLSSQRESANASLTHQQDPYLRAEQDPQDLSRRTPEQDPSVRDSGQRSSQPERGFSAVDVYNTQQRCSGSKAPVCDRPGVIREIKIDALEELK